MIKFAGMTAGLPGELRAVVVVNRPERTHHREVVGAAADVLEPVADDESALAVGLVAGLEREDDLAIAVGGVAADDVLAFAFKLMGSFVAIAKVQGARDLGGVGAMIAINLVFTFAIPGISIGGHLGGLAGGLVCGTAYELIARRTRGTTTQALGVLVALALCAVGLIVGIIVVS